MHQMFIDGLICSTKMQYVSLCWVIPGSQGGSELPGRGGSRIQSVFLQPQREAEAGWSLGRGGGLRPLLTD